MFDLLRDGDEDLRPSCRCASGGPGSKRCSTACAIRACGSASRSSATAARCTERAEARGLGRADRQAARLASTSRAGASPDWRKLKLVRHQTCVIGGWTEPRGSRPFFGALLLGVYDDDGAAAVHRAHRRRLHRRGARARVEAAARAARPRPVRSPTTPRTNERPHWVKPKLVAEVKFTEWTADSKLRHPTYLGLRDDIDAGERQEEPDTLAQSARPQRLPRASDRSCHAAHAEARACRSADHAAERAAESRRSTKAAVTEAARSARRHRGRQVATASCELPGGDRLDVTNLGKIFWPKLKLTKGDLFRHYVRVAPCILPVLADRPLVMKRYPNGVAGKPFYQHRAPDKVPAGRARRAWSTTGTETRPHLVGGSLMTLLYTAQLAIDLAGSVVLTRRLADVDRPRRDRSRSAGRICPSRACSTSRAGSATSSTR